MQILLQPDNNFLIVYGIQDSSIDSKTLNVTLSSFLEILDKIYKQIAPESRIEFKIVSTRNGSFIVEIKEYFTEGEFKKDVRGLAFNLLAAFIMLGPSSPKPVSQSLPQPDIITVTLNNQTFEMPVTALDDYKKIRQNPSLIQPFNEAMYVLRNDPNVKSITLVSDATKINEAINIERGQFANQIDGNKLVTADFFHDGITLQVLNIKHENKKIIGIFLWETRLIIAEIPKHKYSVGPSRFSPGKKILVDLIEVKENDLYTKELIHESFKLNQIY